MSLDDMLITPASLRAGGCTYMYISGESVGRLQHFGRWTTASTLFSYIQESVSRLAWSSLPTAQRDECMCLVAENSNVLSAPPACSARAFWQLHHGSSSGGCCVPYNRGAVRFSNSDAAGGGLVHHGVRHDTDRGVRQTASCGEEIIEAPYFA